MGPESRYPRANEPHLASAAASVNPEATRAQRICTKFTRPSHVSHRDGAMSDLPADEVSRYRESPWTDALGLRLRQLWEEGHSAAEIGRRIGFSKNAVISKAHRLDLPARPSPIRSKNPIQTHERRLAYRRGRAVEKRLRTLVMFGLAPEAAYGLLATLSAPPAQKPPKHPRNGGSHICPTKTLAPLASTVRTVEPCPRCGGTGRLRVDEPECNGGAISLPCEKCRGTGLASSTLAPDSAPPETTNVPTSRLRPITVQKPLAAFPGALVDRPDTCQWPEGDPKHQDFRWCGMPAKPGRPYCLAHCETAYVPLGAKP